MRKKELIVIVALFVVVIGFSFYSTNFDKIGNEDIRFVCFGGDCFNLEIADTNEEKERGLMFRESLSEGSGMLFLFEEPGIYKFWMKNTLIPLDIIWIGSDLDIVYIANAIPCEEEPCEVYDPNTEAFYVLEVNAGVAEELGLGVGDKVDFKK